MDAEVIELRVPRGGVPERADKYVAARVGSVSRARLRRAFDAGCVTLDGAVVGRRDKLAGPGLLRAELETPEAAAPPAPVAIPLRVVHEDAAMVVVDKPAGMVTHPGSGTGADTLVHALLHHCDGRLSGVGPPERPGIVHRLDRETSGLIVAAKTDRAHERLAAAFSERRARKRYLALVLGAPRRDAGVCRGAIGRHPVVRTRMALAADGRAAETEWSVAERFAGRAALAACFPRTGRTHQIRVHMAGMGHPLLGDATYGCRPGRPAGVAVPRVMLHAAGLELPHPETGAVVRFEAGPPEDFRAVCASLRALPE
mgnify:CR=1 FL=1